MGTTARQGGKRARTTWNRMMTSGTSTVGTWLGQNDAADPAPAQPS